MDQFIQPQKEYCYTIGTANINNELNNMNEPGYGRVGTNNLENQCPRSKSNGFLPGLNSQWDSSFHNNSKSLPPSNACSPVRMQDRSRKPDLKQRPGAIESIAIEGSGPYVCQQPSPDYKLYERGNIIAASKYPTPKQVENVTSNLTNMTINEKTSQDILSRAQHSQTFHSNVLNNTAHSLIDHNKYYSTSLMVKPSAASPTHSHSGSSRESNSPRTSIAGIANTNYDYSKNSPLYENIDYYNSRAAPQVPPYYHQLPQTHSCTPSNNSLQDSKHSSPRTSYIGIDNNTNYKYETNFKKAQPQVPVGNKYSSPNTNSLSYSKEVPPYEAPPVYENIQDLNKPQNYESRPGPQVPHHAESRPLSMPHNVTMPPPYPLQNPSNINISQPPPQYTATLQKQPMPQISQISAYEQTPQSILLNPVTAKSISTPVMSVGTCQTSVAMSNQCSVMSGIAGSASPVRRETPSPTLSAKMKGMAGSGKNLLPYNVTPPRSQVR